MTSAKLFSSTLTDPGLLVTVDGPNGAGKTALVQALSEELSGSRRVHTTRQPSPTTLGGLIRGQEQSYRGRALACLVAGDRHHQMTAEILPSLRTGAVVLCDRYVESSLVLQRLDGLEIEEIVGLNQGILRPDVRIRLFAHPDALRARLAARDADPSRRFERAPDGPERELILYEEADQLLRDHYGLPSLVFDTTHTQADDLARRIVSGLESRSHSSR
jgi:dTMP kinase